MVGFLCKLFSIGTKIYGWNNQKNTKDTITTIGHQQKKRVEHTIHLTIADR